MRLQLAELDSEFFVRVGDSSRVGELSKMQLVHMIDEKGRDIETVKRDRGLKTETRKARVLDATEVREKCISELSRIIRRESFKEFCNWMRNSRR